MLVGICWAGGAAEDAQISFEFAGLDRDSVALNLDFHE
jgi:hypothetical protein